MAVASPQIPARWYVDPFGRHEHRYWDGRQWTQHVSSKGRQGIDSAVGRVTLPGANQSREVATQPPRRAADEGEDQAPVAKLLTEQVLIVNQKAKLFGSTVGYAVYDRNGQRLGSVQEIGRDLNTKMRDRLYRGGDKRRTYRLQVVDTENRVLLCMTRPQTRSGSMMIVEAPDGHLIGLIRRETSGAAGATAELANMGLGAVAGKIAGTRFVGATSRLNSAMEELAKVEHVRFGLEASGQRLGAITADNMHSWNFTIRNVAGTEVGRITKRWDGWAKERYTNADNYVVQMHQPLEGPMRSLVIAAALALDIALYQAPEPRSSTQLKYEEANQHKTGHR